MWVKNTTSPWSQTYVGLLVPSRILFCGTNCTRWITIYNNTYASPIESICKTYWNNKKVLACGCLQGPLPLLCPQLFAYDQTPFFADVLYGRLLKWLIELMSSSLKKIKVKTFNCIIHAWFYLRGHPVDGESGSDPRGRPHKKYRNLRFTCENLKFYSKWLKKRSSEFFRLKCGKR